MIVIFLTAIIEAHALVTTTGTRGTELAPLFKLSVYIPVFIFNNKFFIISPLFP